MPLGSLTPLGSPTLIASLSPSLGLYLPMPKSPLPAPLATTPRRRRPFFTAALINIAP